MSEPIDHQCCMLRSAHLVASILVYALPQSRSLSDMSEVLKVKRLSEFASLPVRGSEFAAGYDVMAAADSIVPSRGKALVMTDLAIEIPPNTYARIAPRSGLAWKHSLDTGAGVIDYDYRGNVGVILFNHGPNDFEVKRGDRIAQLILERISMAHCEEVQELGGTQRGEGGFGSTGVDGGSLKKPKTTDTAVSSATMGELLLFVQEVQSALGNTYTARLKEIIFSSVQADTQKLEAIMREYRETASKESLGQSLALVCKLN